jgi:hypothetical protein
MACSYWLYVDMMDEYTGVEVETTCPLYVVADNLAKLDYKKSSGWNVMTKYASEGVNIAIIEPKGSIIHLVYKITRLNLPFTPCRAPTVPQPFPPYTVADIEIVIDSSPKVDLYGLEDRRSSVVGIVKRTRMTGRGYLQLVEADKVVDGPIVVGRDIEWFEASWPILSVKESVNKVKVCEKSRGFNLVSWGLCLEEACLDKQDVELFERLLKSSHPCIARILAATAIRSGISPYTLWGKRVSMDIVKNADSIVFTLTGLSRLGLYLRRREGDEQIIVLKYLKEGANIIDGVWEEYSLFCKECWRSIVG